MTVRRFASLGGALVVAAIAALASYSHMRSVALEYGQPELIADLLPVSVDGMMAVATVALGDGRSNRWSAWLAFWTGVAASVLANVLAAEPFVVARCISAWPAIAFVLVVEVITRGGRVHAAAIQHASQTAAGTACGESPAPAATGRSKPPAPRGRQQSTTDTARRPIALTRELAAKLRAEHPEISQAELARRLGISATRLRQVDRAPSVSTAGEVRPEVPLRINDRKPPVGRDVPL